MLFASDPINKIENFLNNARAKQMEIQAQEQKRKQAELQQHAQQFMANGPLSQSALLTEVDKLLDFTNQRKLLDPSDTDAQKQMGILNQLRDVLSNTTLPAEMLPKIQQQLVTFNQKEAARVNVRARTATPPLAQGSGFPDLSKLPMFNQPQSQPQPQPQPQFNMPPMQQFPMQTQQQPQQQQPFVPPNLLNSLQSAGLLNFNGRGGTPGAGGPQVSIQVELTNASLQTPRKELIDQLYKQMPKQCGTCGKRFPDTEDGRQLRNAHLDWHFRVNKKLREENRSNHRCWYLPQEEWLDYKDEEEILGLIPENKSDSKNGKEAEKKKKEINLEKEAKKYVPVPSDKKLANQPCPICQEKFQSVWNDKVEDWVWKNAVKADGKRIFHATCYAENEDATKRVEPPKPKNINQLLGNMNLADILANANKRKRPEEDTSDANVKKEPKIE